MTAQTLLEAVSLTRSFGDFVAADEVTMHVEAGEVVGLLGANGAGKTTTIKMLLGLLRPTSGKALVLGESPSRRNRIHLGYVPQGLGLYRTLTVAENLAFSAAMFGVTGEPEMPAELAEVRDRQVGGLPLGQQRQLAFACALMHRPKVLVLDEPTSGVDPVERARLWDAIRDQADSGVGVLVTTHYMQEAQQCDRLLLMSRGRVVGAGSEADIIGGTTAIEVSASDWSTAFSCLSDAGQPVALAGTSVRVAGGDEGELRAILAAAGIGAELRRVPGTIEERMTILARSGPDQPEGQVDPLAGG